MKERLDVLLVNRNLARSREKAKAIIMSGIVFVDGQKEDKAGTTFEDTAVIEVRGSTLKYVSRGGLKLEKAMTHFGVELQDKICMDVGASTGGFTDCMLQNGAVKVYAVDVGHGQLDWKLRNDERVVCMEKTNIRYVTGEHVPDRIQFASIDVSFISLTKVLGPVKALLTDDGQVVCLIKPQFEAGREKVGRKGVVREKSTHLEVIEAVMVFARSIGFEILNLEYSPIKGPEGNIEYLLYLQNCPSGDGKVEEMLEAAGENRETGQQEKAEESGEAKRRTETGQPQLQSPRCPVDARAVVDAAHKSL
jgi:23S rRNA (cytidine1920-2'-O)/16S rRNA (cytidine1409-2'-O)-methyltransferase